MRFNLWDESPNTTAAAASLCLIALPLLNKGSRGHIWCIAGMAGLGCVVLATQSRSGLTGFACAFFLLYRTRLSSIRKTYILTAILSGALLICAFGVHRRLAPESLLSSCALRLKTSALTLMNAAERNIEGDSPPFGMAENGYLRFGFEFTPEQLWLLKRPLSSLLELLVFPWWQTVILSAVLVAPLIGYGLSLRDRDPAPWTASLSAATAMFLVVALFNDLRQDRMGMILLVVFAILGLVYIVATRRRFGWKLGVASVAFGILWSGMAIAGGLLLLKRRQAQLTVATDLTYFRSHQRPIVVIQSRSTPVAGTAVFFHDRGDIISWWRVRRALFAMTGRGWRIIEVQGNQDWPMETDALASGSRTVFVLFCDSSRQVPESPFSPSLQLLINPRPIDYFIRSGPGARFVSSDGRGFPAPADRKLYSLDSLIGPEGLILDRLDSR